MTDKRKQWQEIQARAPDFAEFLIELNAVFGKVRLLDVEFASETLTQNQF